MIDPDKIPDPNFVVPDLTEAIEGWRAWRVKATPPMYGTTPKLYSVSHSGYYWTPRRRSQARCGNAPAGRCYMNPPGDIMGVSRLPGERCSCGFYTAGTLEHLLTMAYPGYHEESGEVCVIGRVANWGKVIECATGWRSEFAYPVELFVPYETWQLAKPLAHGYGVKVRLKNWLTEALDPALRARMEKRQLGYQPNPT